MIEGTDVVMEESSEPKDLLQSLTSRLDSSKIDKVRSLLQFFINNKHLLNLFISVNLSSIDQHFQSLVVLIPEIFDFETKRLLWKACIKKHAKKITRGSDEYEIDLGIRRDQVFADSFEQLKDMETAQWLEKFSVEFHGEEGVDEGGLTKEWFELISKGIFDPNYALFLRSSSSQTYFPNPNSLILEEKEMI